MPRASPPRRVRAEEGLRYIHSANEPLLIAGVATYALELFEVVPDLDVLFVPVGAGSGVLGAAVVARAINPSTRVIGVQAEGASALYQSWTTGRRVVIEAVTTFAEGLATREPFDLPMQLLPRLVDEIMLVSDAELVAAIRLLLETTHQVAEGAGAAAVAGAVRRRAELHGKRVGMVLSGGNITMDQLRGILNMGPPELGASSAVAPGAVESVTNHEAISRRASSFQHPVEELIGFRRPGRGSRARRRGRRRGAGRRRRAVRRPAWRS